MLFRSPSQDIIIQRSRPRVPGNSPPSPRMSGVIEALHIFEDHQLVVYPLPAFPFHTGLTLIQPSPPVAYLYWSPTLALTVASSMSRTPRTATITNISSEYKSAHSTFQPVTCEPTLPPHNLLRNRTSPRPRVPTPGHRRV